MYTFSVSLKYSRDGQKWLGNTVTIKADSRAEAIMQAEHLYPYVREVKVLNQH